MKKLFILILAVIMLLTVAGMSFASMPKQVQVFMLNEKGDAWGAPVDCLGLHAKAFVSDPESGMCDKMFWCEKISCNVSVSQWISYCFSGTRWDWQIRKPGTFAADCITFKIQSNDDVKVTCCGFDNLAGSEGETPINVWYSMGSLEANGPPTVWYAPADLNGHSYELPYETICKGVTYRLWNKIQINGDTRAGNYSDTGMITLTLTDVKPFINPWNGNYWFPW